MLSWIKIDFVKAILAIALSICFVLFSSVGFTQVNKFYAELSVGPSFPIGKFANKDYMDSSAGFATLGVAANVSFGYQLNNKISVLFSIGGSQHAQDEEARELKGGPGMGGSVTTDVDAEKWKAIKLMLGARLSSPVSFPGKISFYTDISAGICKTAIPEYSGIVYVNNMLSGSFTYGEIKLPWSFCYQIGAGLKYGLNEKIYLVGNLNYFDSAPVHHGMKNINPPNPAGPYAPFETKYHLSTINVSVGAGIYF